MHRLALLLAAALVAVPAYASGGADGTIVASDYAFTNPATGGTTITIAPGEAVTFSYPEGTERHNVAFTGPEPAGCEPALPERPANAPWTATCTFAAADEYAFVCDFHPEMAGRVIVRAAPTPTPTRTATPTPTLGSPPGQPPPATVPSPEQTTPQTPAASRPTVARRQRGRAVRGSIILAARARLTVELRRGGRRLGRSTKTVAAGRRSFAVRLNARGRKALRRGRLALTVRITVTPASGAAYTATRKVTLSRPG